MPDTTIPVTPSAWKALQVQAKFYAETAAILLDKRLTDISQLACIAAKCYETEKTLNKIRGLD